MPSIDFSDRWFYKAGKSKQGPVSTNALRDMLQRGVLVAESAVWRDGMESWVPAREVGELFAEGLVLPSATTDYPTSLARWRVLILGMGLAIMVLVAIKTGASWLLSSRDSDPYSYRYVSGSIRYEDGQVVPADVLTLTFIPLAPPHNPRVYPRPGFAVVDPKTGAFQSVTSRKPGDGLVKGGHKVLITGGNRVPLPENIVPLEYTDFKTTPLEVDTESGEFNLKVKRPVEKPRKEDDKSPKS